MIMVTEWLPIAAEIDEPFFVLPAARMAAQHDPNPHWFGHPASTLLYPLAALYTIVWGPRVPEAFAAHPSTFFLSARLLSIAATALGLWCVYLLIRRAFDDTTGLIAVAIVGTTITMSLLGRSARSDGVALLFGTLALHRLLRAFETPSRRELVLSGIALGAAIATKYYFAVFGAAYLAIAMRERRRLRAVLGALALAALCTVATFAILTPYFFLDWRTAMVNLSTEVQPHVASVATPLHALGWYLTRGVRELLRWPGLIAAAVGIAISVANRRRGPLILLAAVGLFVMSISVLKLTWDRWLLPVLPILAGFAAHGVMSLSRAAARRVNREFIGGVAAIVLTSGVLGGSAYKLATVQVPTTAMLMREAIYALPSGARLLFENDGGEWIPANLEDPIRDDVTLTRGAWSITARRQFSRIPVEGETLESYRCQGFDHLIINWGPVRAMRAGTIPSTPHALAFYDRIAREGRFVQLIARFDAGPPFRIYSIRHIPCATSRPG